MTDWTFARDAWTRRFAPLAALAAVGGQGRVERLDRAAYWALYEARMAAHVLPEIFIDCEGLRTPAQVAGQARLAAASGPGPGLEDFGALRRGDDVVAMFGGLEVGRGRYRMRHSAVHPDYRRRGIYAHVVRCTLAYTEELGFDTLESDHSPANNAVIIAKLREGFRIYAMEIDPRVGASVKLCYFHNAALLRAFELRCGLAVLDDELIAAGGGAMGALVARLRGE